MLRDLEDPGIRIPLEDRRKYVRPPGHDKMLSWFGYSVEEKNGKTAYKKAKGTRAITITRKNTEEKPLSTIGQIDVRFYEKEKLLFKRDYLSLRVYLAQSKFIEKFLEDGQTDKSLYHEQYGEVEEW